MGYPLLGFILCIYVSCSRDWTQTIKRGNIKQTSFLETVPAEIKHSLIFIPITIKGKQYNFLFDTGAPLCLSDKLQREFSFKQVSKGNIVDSDNNKKEVPWVSIERIKIGNIDFENQTAFVGDFNTNPFFNCLKIDGIIGANLIRQANWIINQQDSTLSFTDKSLTTSNNALPFKTDYQYLMYVNLKIGNSLVNGVLADYGSNGGFAVTSEIYSTLEKANIIEKTKTEIGKANRGIVGKSIDINQKFAYHEDVSIGNQSLIKTLVIEGKTTSIGNEIFSQFIVSIDWKNQRLILNPRTKPTNIKNKPDFRVGLSNNKLEIQSVVLESDAYKKGVRPGMKILKIDHLDFQNGSTFCDYVDYKRQIKTHFLIEDSFGKEFSVDVIYD